MNPLYKASLEILRSLAGSFDIEAHGWIEKAPQAGRV